jgi:transposase
MERNFGIFEFKKKRKYDLRSIMDALLYVVRTGCQWRNLPECFPKWQSVYWYFSRWKKQNILLRSIAFSIKLIEGEKTKTRIRHLFALIAKVLSYLR